MTHAETKTRDVYRTRKRRRDQQTKLLQRAVKAPEGMHLVSRKVKRPKDNTLLKLERKNDATTTNRHFQNTRDRDRRLLRVNSRSGVALRPTRLKTPCQERAQRKAVILAQGSGGGPPGKWNEDSRKRCK